MDNRQKSVLNNAKDEVLAIEASQGNNLAFAELYRRYHAIFGSYACRRLGDDFVDSVQGTFSAIYQKLAGYQGPRFFSWAYRICVNTVTDELRKKQNQGPASFARAFLRKRVNGRPCYT